MFVFLLPQPLFQFSCLLIHNKNYNYYYYYYGAVVSVVVVVVVIIIIIISSSSSSSSSSYSFTIFFNDFLFINALIRENPNNNCGTKDPYST